MIYSVKKGYSHLTSSNPIVRRHAIIDATCSIFAPGVFFWRWKTCSNVFPKVKLSTKITAGSLTEINVIQKIKNFKLLWSSKQTSMNDAKGVDTTILYRSVNHEELNQILETKQFEQGPNSLGGGR